MSDRNQNADSGRSIEKKEEATVLDVSGPRHDPDVYLVEYDDGYVTYEPATPENIALFEDDLYGEIQGTTTYHGLGDSDTITFEGNVQSNRYRIAIDDAWVTIPIDRFEEIIDAVRSDRVGEKLLDLYHDVLGGQVRRHVVEKFTDRYPDDRVEITDEGWIVDDTFLVNWGAENYLVDHEQTFVREGGEMVQADERKQALDLGFEVGGERSVNGTVLSEDEQVFLATVDVLIDPDGTGDENLIERVETAKEHTWDDGIDQIVSTATVDGFTTERSAESHSHDLDKHYLSDAFDLTGRAVDELYEPEYSHLSVTELSIREDEFRNADFEVFTDVPNDCDERWEEVANVREKAPVSAKSLTDLKETLEENGHRATVTY